MTNEWTVACKEFNIGVGRIDTILAQRTLSLEIRGFEDSDYRRLAEIYDAIFPERARSVEEWRFYDDSLEKELREDPECYTKLYERVQTAFRDVPIADTPTDTPYDQWLAFEMKNPNLIPQAYMIAKDGDKYVGTSVVWRLKKEPRSLYQGLTGVLRE